MGPPRARSLLLMALLLLAALAAFYQGQSVASKHSHATPRPRALSTPRTTPPAHREAATRAAAPRRTISLECARAGPHWRKELPTVTTSAVELLPLPFSHASSPYEEPQAAARRRRLEPFAPSAIALHGGTHVAAATATNLQYLLSLRPEDLLYAWRRNAGVAQPAGARPLRGWESPGSELRGHVLGHWLSAVALSVASTGDPRLRDRLDGVLAALEACQQADGWLSAFPDEFLDRVESLKPVWAPYYTLHKLLQGLLDVHEMLGLVAPLTIALRLAKYVQLRVRRLVETRSLEHHWTTLNKEFGGMNDVLWRLYAEGYDAAAFYLFWRLVTLTLVYHETQRNTVVRRPRNCS